MAKALTPPKKTKNVMIRMPLDLYEQALAKAIELEYSSLTRFILDSVKLGLKKKPVSQ